VGSKLTALRRNGLGCRRNRIFGTHTFFSRQWWRRPGWWPAEGNCAAAQKEVIVCSVLEVAGSQEREVPAIGTLNEGALHAQLKNWYQRPDDRIERVIDGFVVDLVRGDLLVEIQTGSFAPLRRKLELLTRQHRVRLVAPIPLVRRIIRLSDEGELLSARRSPRLWVPKLDCAVCLLVG
jgi:hypothetical protein